MPCTRPTLVALATASLLAACSSSSPRPIQLPSFNDLGSAPQAIQDAARAVVRIRTSGGAATGTFISRGGVLLTNNHVLGVDVCPVEGCYAEITSMYQRGSPLPMPTTVFVVPMAVDVGLDMAVVQVYAASGSNAAMMTSPNYLTLDSRSSAASLIGKHVYVVGHPEGHLKKWTQGEIVDSDGTWITFSAFSLPGNSGSPVLDDAGHMIGILHRGPTTLGLVSSAGVDVYSVGTAASALLTAMGAPLPAAMWSIAAPATDADVASHQAIYLNAQVTTAMVGGASKPVIDSLGVACDTGLAQMSYGSPEDLFAGLQPCTDAEGWINCATDLTSGTFAVCPATANIAAWQQRYKSAYDRVRALNGQLQLDLVSFGPTGLAVTTSAAALLVGSQALQQALSAATPPLDFTLAYYLASFNIGTYAGTRVADFVQAYASYPDYVLAASDIVNDALALTLAGQWNQMQLTSLLQALASNPNVDLVAKLFIEDVQYQLGIVN